MRRRTGAAVSAAVFASVAALSGSASAQDEQVRGPTGPSGPTGPTGPGASGPTGSPTSPAGTGTTPAAPQQQTTTEAAPVAGPTGPTGPAGLGSLDVEVDKLPPAATRKQREEAERRRRAGARRFLREEHRRASTKKRGQERDAVKAAPPAATAPSSASPFDVPAISPVSDAAIAGFAVPPFLLPIYQAAGMQYGVRWEVLAAINAIETDYGRNLNVSSAGALGWMQFMPGTWASYGTDANGDGEKDPYNPVDAIFAAARYLKAAGASEDLEAAIFAYNHAQWYVDDVMQRARALAAMPSDVVGALTGLSLGRLPLDGRISYGAPPATGRSATAYHRVPRTIDVFGRAGAAVVATQDGRVVSIGESHRLGRYMRVRDAYGNTYTYGHLSTVSALHIVPRSGGDDDVTPKAPKADPKPTAPATAGKARAATAQTAAQAAEPAVKPVKERLFANPTRPAAYHAGGERQLEALAAQAAPQEISSGELGRYLSGPTGLRRADVVLLPLKEGSRIIAGTILGRIGERSISYDRHTRASAAAARRFDVKTAPHLRFEVRPAGTNAPRIDPKPILDGWKLLDSADVYRSGNAMLGGTADASVGQILLMSKEALTRRVLANPDIDIYAAGRADIRAGVIDRRVLATLEFLTASGLKPTVSCLRAGHSFLTASGNVSEHSSGNAVDISAINGIPILGHQGAGSITDVAVRRLLELQGSMKPHQIITLMQYDGTDNTLALPDHANHIHVGFHPRYGDNAASGKELGQILEPGQWKKLIGRVSSIENPDVALKPSRYSIKVRLKVKAAKR